MAAKVFPRTTLRSCIRFWGAIFWVRGAYDVVFVGVAVHLLARADDLRLGCEGVGAIDVMLHFILIKFNF